MGDRLGAIKTTMDKLVMAFLPYSNDRGNPDYDA